MLDPEKAETYLIGDNRWKRFKHIRDILKVIRLKGPKGGFRQLSYSYTDDRGIQCSTNVSDREEAADLEEFFKMKGVEIREEQLNPDPNRKKFMT